jgi:hypothetical protein
MDNSMSNNSEENRKNDNGIHKFSMNKKGDMHVYKGGVAASLNSTRTFIIFGWVSAALTSFVWPYFAIVGIVLGYLANRQVKGSGNLVIITNIVMAAVRFLFGFLFAIAIRRIIFGF